jgi:DNA polymerase III alpha subunit
MGGSRAEGDQFRKAVQNCRDDAQRLDLSRRFLDRCRQARVDLDTAKGLWVQMAKFNAYSFCRAHAASYATLAYAGAYLKRHWPREFFVAALNNNQSMYPPRVYVEAAKRAGVAFLRPDVNRSDKEFTLEDSSVRVGLDRVAGLGPTTVQTILDARSRRPFEGLSDFLARTRLGREEARALVLCGAFDWTDRKRPTLMMELNLFGPMSRAASRDETQLLAAGPVIPDPPGDYTALRKYLDERRILGFSTGEHLMALCRPHLNGSTDADSRDLPARVGRTVTIAGLPEAMRTTRTQNGRTVAFLTMDDEFGLFEVTVFPGAARPCRLPTRYGPTVITGGVETQYDAITLRATRIAQPRILLQRQPR